jgi:hypothetical protein
MASLFSSNEYINIVLVYGEALGVLLDSREFPCYFLSGYMKDLVYSIPIDTIVLTITAVTLNTSCNG